MRTESAPISPALADRYGMLPAGCSVICAVSGGADSVCLLHWLLSLAPSRGLRVSAMHFDHRLRGAESARDAAFVQRLCAEWGVELFLGSGDAAAYAAEKGLGVEEAARELRYAFFEETAAKRPGCRVATAHTADDNAETVLMHLARGSGLRGLGGIPPVRGQYIRPLLHTERSEILRYLKENELSWVEDSSNGGDEYARNRLRHGALPLLRREYPALLRSVSACAERLREDEAYLSAEAARLLPWAEEEGALVGSAAALCASPRPLALRALRDGGERLGLRLSAERLEALLRLAEGESPSGCTELPGGAVALREYDRLLLCPALPEAAALGEHPLSWNAWTEVPELGLRVWLGEPVKKEDFAYIFHFKKAELCGIITIRPRRGGDRLVLDRGRGGKSLKKWMIEEKIPLRERGRVPVVADEAGVLALIPYGVNLDRGAEDGADCVIAVKSMGKAGETAGERV